jgi:MFS family permease
MTNRWTILAALSFARVSMGFQFQTVAATAPLLSDQLGFDSAQIGWLIGLYLLPGVLVALPGGMLGARYGDRRVAVVGLAMMILGGIGFAACESIGGASAARAVMGAGAVLMNVLLFKMATDWFSGKEMILAMSILVNTWPIGIGLALLAQGALALAVSWQAAFVATAVLAAVGMLVMLIVYKSAAGAPMAQSVDLAALSARDWKVLIFASLPWALYNAPFLLIVAFLPSYLVEQGHSIVSAGGLTAINTVLAIVSVQAGGILVQRFGHADRFAYASLAGLVATMIGLIASQSPLPWIIASGLVAGLPAGIFVSLPGEILRAESRATGMGIFYTIFYAGTAAAPVIGGALAKHFGSVAATLWMAVALIILCAAAHAVFRSLQRGSPREFARPAS